MDNDQWNASSPRDTTCSTLMLPPSSPDATGWAHETAACSSNLFAHGVLRPNLDCLILPLVLSLHTNAGSVGQGCSSSLHTDEHLGFGSKGRRQ